MSRDDQGAGSHPDRVAASGGQQRRCGRGEIDSLNGRNTSSTHTIYVTKVETNATGGLVGGVRRFADGGAVAPAFPRMSGGSVPGSGHHDTVPRTLDAGPS